MSVSKLESLPNEILIIILEKYINSVDILNAFAFQLNRRFDSLINGCRRFRFDFIRCHKNDFSLCMGLLLAYIDKIEELALSEQNTPGQIYAFLCFFSKFDLFKSLRKLYLNIDASVVEPKVLELALHSLTTISLHTLWLTIKNEKKIISFHQVVSYIFSIKTLKKLFINCESFNMQKVMLPNRTFSNIEYLTIEGVNCTFENLYDIFQCAPALKYLNIQIECLSDHVRNKLKPCAKDVIPQMSMLHTAIFKIKDNVPRLLSKLKSYFLCMPSLRSLEITTNKIPDDIRAWETLLETSLPKLTHFNLKIILFQLFNFDNNVLQKSFQTPFWIEKKNFNVIIKALESNSITDALSTNNARDMNPYVWNISPDACWIGTRHELNDDLFITNQILNLKLLYASNSLLQEYYRENLKYLEVKEFDYNLFKLLTTHYNCSHISQLDISQMKQTKNNISLFLPYIKNITSLRINVNQLFDKQFAYLAGCKDIKSLDISADQHNFRKKHLSIIKKMFPNIEHLSINTQDLQNVHYYKFIYLVFIVLLSYMLHQLINILMMMKMWKTTNRSLQQKTEFLFQFQSNKITVWIDQVALKDSYWKNIESNSQLSNNDSWFKKLSAKISSIFN